MSLLLISRIAGTSVIDAGIAPAVGEDDERPTSELANGLFGRLGLVETRSRKPAAPSESARPWNIDGLMTAA